MLDVVLSNQAQRFLDKAPQMLAARFAKKLEDLRKMAIPSDAKRVNDSSRKLWRVRVGDYRILYEVSFEQNRIGVSKIDHRSRVYD